MKRFRRTCVAACVALLLVSLAISTDGQEAPAPDAQGKAAVYVARLSAKKAFLAESQSHEHSLPEDTLRELVLNSLRKLDSPPPKQMPAVEQLQEQLTVDFDALWEQWIKDATAGLDPDGKLKLADWLRGDLEDHDELWKDAKAKHDDFVNKQLPQTLESVKAKLVQEQTDALTKALQVVIEKGMPSQDMILQARAGDAQSVVDALQRGALEQLKPEQLEILLVESCQRVAGEQQAVVEDGVAQLEEQLDVFQALPTAVSLPGIEDELRSKYQSVAGRQQELRAAAPLRRAYGVFEQVQQALQEQTRRWFDVQVAAAVEGVTIRFASGQLEDSAEEDQSLRTAILGQIQAHHDSSESWRILEPQVQNIALAKRDNVQQQLADKRAKSKSRADQECPAPQFQADVTGVMEAEGSQSSEEWSELRRTVVRSYEQQRIPAIRKQIAQEQSQKYAPALMRQQWWPAEAVLQSCTLPLTVESLAALPCWQDAPPPKTDVLAETWKIWMDKAEHAVSVGQDAMQGQSQAVVALKETMLARIRKAPDQDAAHWRTIYVDAVSQQWRNQSGEPARRYPELFQATRDQIDGILAQLIPEAERQNQEELVPEPMDEPLPRVEAPTENPVTVPDAAVVQEGMQTPDESANQSASGDNEGDGGGGESDGGQEGEGMGDGEGDGQEEKEDELLAPEEDMEKLEMEHEELEPRKRVPVEVLSVPLNVSELSWRDKFYQIGFWLLLVMVVVISCCWYWNVRALKRELARYRQSNPLPVR